MVYFGMKRGRPFQETTTCRYHLCLDMVLAKFRGMINFLWYSLYIGNNEPTKIGFNNGRGCSFPASPASTHIPWEEMTTIVNCHIDLKQLT